MKVFIKKILLKIYSIFIWLIKKIFILFPIKENKIIFDNFIGQGYAGNPKYIADELLVRNLNLDLVWLLKDTSAPLPNGIRKVKYGSIKSLYEYATSKIIVDNVRNAHLLKKKKGQIYLQTWHGGRPLKYIEKDAIEKLNANYIKSAKYDGSIADAIVADSKLQEDIFRRAFWLNDDVEILKYGIPRNDILLNNDKFKEIIHKVRKHLNIEEKSFVILYAPTFRDNQKTDSYIKNFDDIIEAFESKLQKKCIVLLRLHPNEKENIIDWNISDKIINASAYPDVQELAILSDCVISDYSSVIFDFMQLKKPIFLYSSDLPEYVKLRGLSDDYFELPFPRANTLDELIKCVKDFEYSYYLNKILNYKEKYPIYDDGNATKNITNWIIEKMKGVK